MFENSLKISILIVTRKWNADLHTFDYIKRLKHHNIEFEVLLAEGNNPSYQRNRLASLAAGDFILFLDDDSIPVENLLEIYRKTLLVHQSADILGGPSLLVSDKHNLLYRLTHVFFSSPFGVGPIRSRYNSIGSVRKATECDLILCNLLMKKDFFLKTKGFNQSLFPGEENEFLKRINSDTEIIYDPSAIVYRRPRETFYLFLKQMFSYGKGRAKHLNLIHPFEYLFLIPIMFSLYVLCLPFLIYKSPYFSIPIYLHLTISLLTSRGEKESNLTIYQKPLFPFFVFAGHFIYGLGQVVGIGKYKLLRKLIISANFKDKVQIQKLKFF